MTHPIKGIDHIVLLVSDLDASAERFEALGFRLSPRGQHSAHMGTANYTIIFPEDYFELLGVIAETPRNANWRNALAERGEGMVGIACRIDEAHAARAALAALGIAADEVMDFSRPLPLPDGSTGVAAFGVSTFAPAEVPKGHMFMCGHKTRDMVWRPELMTHANGARALAGVVVATDNPEATAKAYQRLFAAGRITPTDGGFRVETGSSSAVISCLTPAAVTALYPGLDATAALRGHFAALQIGVADLAATRAVLTANGVPFTPGAAGKSLCIAPADGAGTILEFVAQ